MSLSIRPFRDSDVAAVVALENSLLPSTRRRGVIDRRREFLPNADLDVMYLVAGDPPVAFLSVIDYPRIPRDRVHDRLHLLVAPEYRERGIGDALLERALVFARERRAKTLTAQFYRLTEEDPALPFLAHRGFAEVESERRQTAHLDLDTFDAVPFSELVKRAERQGVRLLPCEQLPDTPEHRRRLYDLLVGSEMIRDGSTFQEWGSGPNRWTWAQEALVVAELAGAWVAFTQVAAYRRDTGVWRTAHAATLPAYRNRGIATALKLRSIQMLRNRGCRVLLTANRVDNTPILAINRKLGYVSGPLEVMYQRTLRGVV